MEIIINDSFSRKVRDYRASETPRNNLVVGDFVIMDREVDA